MKKIFRLIFFTLVIAFCSFTQKLHAKTGLNESVLNEYLKLQKEFSDISCKPGTEATFQELDKNYRGDGNFIPITIDDKIDFKTIKNHLSLLKEKSAWIQSQIDFIKKNQNLENIKLTIDRLENDASLLLEAKKDYFLTSKKEKKERIQIKSAAQFQQLLKEIINLKNQIPFLLTFKFPVNHLSLRSEYELYKNQPGKEARERANSIYFYRKIVQDGSYDEDLSRNDSSVRSSFDTLFLSLNKEPHRIFLNDNERVDLNYVLNNFDKLLSLKPEALIARFEDWKARNERSLTFYQELLDGQKLKKTSSTNESRFTDVLGLLEERARALYTLKDFVLSKEASVYEFWSQRSELLQSLYAIETILYSEVGRMDAPDGLERRDVAQVIINRAENSSYNLLKPHDSITKYLSSHVKIKENPWLNVLFKEGEFSFTYFYIPGNFHIYCPDMSRIGQFLRRENIRIALELLNKPRTSFKALRYFSRVSMFGRIEMDSLWDQFKLLPEVPGKPVRNPRKLYNLFKRQRYRFLYDFFNEDLKKTYLVVDLSGKTYVVDAKNTKLIYYYRNPHQFKYFSLLK